MSIVGLSGVGQKQHICGSKETDGLKMDSNCSVLTATKEGSEMVASAHTKERPIIFTAESVMAILEGRKTQTRRVIKPQPSIVYGISADCLAVNYRDYENNRWSFAEADPHFAERRLHGRGRWEDLLTHEICWIWEKGFRGLVCVEGTPEREGLSSCFLVPRKYQGNEERASAGVHGISWNAREPVLSGKTSGWKPGELRAEQFEMGHTRGKLERSKDAQSSLHQCDIQVHTGRESTHPVGDWERSLQSAECRSYLGRESILDLRNLPFQIGEILWVRETWTPDGVSLEAAKTLGRAPVHYRADGEAPAYLHVRWRSPIYMPRWASRITLELTGVRVERVQDISYDDAIAEGIEITDARQSKVTTILRYQRRWDSLNAKRDGGIYSWAANPWVWALEFRRVA